MTVHHESAAIKLLEEALLPLDPAAQKRVLWWATIRFGITDLALQKETPAGSSSTSASASGAGAGKKQEIPQNEGIKDFVTRKKPQNTYERIACLVFFLEKFQKVEFVDTKAISQANIDARLPKMTNASIFVNESTRQKGFLSALAHGKKVLSARGEAVVNALPDRELVDEALEQHPFKGRAGRVRSVKKKDAEA